MELPVSPSIASTIVVEQASQLSSVLLHGGRNLPLNMDLCVAQNLEQNPSLIQSPSVEIKTLPEKGKGKLAKKKNVGKYPVELKGVPCKKRGRPATKKNAGKWPEELKALAKKNNLVKHPEEIKALPGKKRGRPAKNPGNSSSTVDLPNSILTATTTPASKDASTTFPSNGPLPLSRDTTITTVTAMSSDEQMVGDLVTDQMNGNPDSSKPLVLVTFCTDGKLESLQLSSLADVLIYSDMCDLSVISDAVCKRIVTFIAGRQCRIDADFLSRCASLKLVVVEGASYNDINLEYASEIGVIVCNVPDVCNEEIADSAFSLILSLYRQTAFLHNAVQTSTPYKQHEGLHPGVKNIRRIRGMNLGLIGLGKVGIAVAQRAKVFGFNVIFYDPSTSEGLEVAIGGLRRVGDITDVLKISDCISLHCSLNEGSRHIIDESALSLMKNGAFLVNVAHGDLVDKVALAEALHGGKLAGAALDTYRICSNEAGFRHSILKDVPNLICTPRTSWYSEESDVEVRSAGIVLAHRALTSLDSEELSRNCVNGLNLNRELCHLRWESPA